MSISVRRETPCWSGSRQSAHPENKEEGHKGPEKMMRDRCPSCPSPLLRFRQRIRALPPRWLVVQAQVRKRAEVESYQASFAVFSAPSVCNLHRGVGFTSRKTMTHTRFGMFARFLSKCSKRAVCHHESLPTRVALAGTYHFSVPESRVFLIGPEAVADETSSLVQSAACSF